MSFTGTVFITGASSGFGEAIARKFAHDGARVIIAGRRIERLEGLSLELGEQVMPVALDVQRREQITAVLAGLPEAFRHVDLLVNNAGLALGLDPSPSASLDDWDRMVDTNCKGLVACTRIFLPGMIERGRGHIINLGSVAGTYPYPGGNVYGATKAFVHQFSLNLRADLLGTPIRVSCIEPGLCGGTEFSATRFKGDQAKADAVYAGTEPLTAHDIAETIHWVASQPSHVNINTIELMPVCQAAGPFAINRR